MNKVLSVKKHILFLILAAFAVGTVNAQSGYTYQQIGVGLDVSYIKGFTNVQAQYSHPAYDLNIVYNVTPYLPFSAEFQTGQLSGGGLSPTVDKYGRQYTNNYKAFLIKGDYQLGNDLDYSYDGFAQLIKNVYVGAGLGFILNSNTVQRTNVIPQNGSLSYVFPGTNNSTSPVLALRIGYEFKIYNYYNVPSMALDIGYTHNIAFGEGLDGYNDPNGHFKNSSPDQYRQFIIGLKFFFGEPVMYTKLIRPFNRNY